MSRPSFTIFTPVYTDKSAGIWMLHFLCDRLNHLGYPSSIVIASSIHATNPAFTTPIAYDPASIVIYPEVVSNNPLNARRVVRYLLNGDGALSGRKIEWGETDFPLSFSRIYRADCDILFYPTVNLEHFFNDGRPRSGYCLYRGKSGYDGPLPNIEFLEITRAWPPTKQELGDIFRSRQLLFSFDTYSSTNLDAALCGCVPILLAPLEHEAELGKFWAHNMSEVGAALREIATLRERIVQFQQSFDERLDAVAAKIAAHFGF